MNCQKGCLKCSKENFCLICDFGNYYVMENDQCVQKNIDFCERISIDGKCIQCFKYHYYDEVHNSCEEIIHKENLVDNCYSYNSPKQCQKCISGFYVNQGKCLRPLQEIKNCSQYLTEKICQECKFGFLLSDNKEECLQIQQVKNCIGYSQYSCVNCLHNYIIDYNLYVQKNFGDFKINGFNTEFFRKTNDLQNVFKENINICTNVMEGCKNQQNSNQCNECREGYFLREKQCVKLYKLKIDNCKKYSSQTQCLKCQEGYFLQFNICHRVQKVQNCKQYDHDSPGNCIECEQEFLLKYKNCEKRLNFIKNCQEYFTTKDECQKCEENYYLLNNNCILQDQCMEFIQQQNKVQCLKCKDSYYLDQNFACIEGNLQNCYQYKFNEQNRCQLCENKYYLQDGNCISHREIQNCQIYEQHEKNICLKCNQNSLKIEFLNQCQEIGENLKIQNCLKYHSLGKCSVCEENYFVNSLNECEKFEQDEKCLQKEKENCLKCETGYVLLKNQCRKMNESLIQNCEGYFQGQCEICDVSMMPIAIKNEVYCVENNEMKFYFENYSIQNCLVYEYKTSLKCVQCKDQYVLYQGTCIHDFQCLFTLFRNTFYPNTKRIFNGNNCIEFEEGCLSGSFLPQNSNLKTCDSCKIDYISKIDLNSENFNFFNSYEQKTPTSPFNQYPQKTCIKIQDTTFYPSKINNCEYYIYNEILQAYICQKCKFFYYGKLKKTNDQIYIENCGEELACDKIEYGGFSLTISNYFSCHVCREQNQIPFVITESGNSFNGKIKYTLYDMFLQSSDTDGFNNECLEKKSEYYLPSNCALAIYNIDSNSFEDSNKFFGVNLEKIKAICIACKPKYRPFYSTDVSNNKVPLMIGNCNFIENCQNSIWFNSCSQCSEDYVWEYKFGEINYQQCISYEGNGCLAAEQKFPTQNHCTICKKDYFLNKKKKCQLMNMKYCTNYYFTPSVDMGTLLHFYNHIEGCQLCENQVNFRQQFEQNICVYDTATFLSDQIIPQCKFYYNNTKVLQCQECKKYYIIEKNKTKCIKNTIASCLIFNEVEGNCFQCEEKFVAHKQSCLPKNILHCKDYKQNVDQNDIQCKECQDYYYLFDNQCILGGVPFCLKYNDKRECIECEKYHLLIENGSKNFCLGIQSYQNCESFFKISNQQVQCTECSKNYFLETETQIQCFFLEKIENCQNYEQIDDDYKVQWRCIECEQNYYLSQNQCKEQLPLKNCKKYSQILPVCVECEDNFFVDQNSHCEQNPKGMIGCLSYDNNDHCIQCDEQYYLQNNFCVEIQNRIQDCKIQIDHSTCKQCIDGYYIYEGKCTGGEIQNCKLYNKGFNCSECKQGFILKNNSCQIHEDIDECLVESKNQKYECLQCFKDFYWNEQLGKCKEGIKINYCEILKSHDKCQQCSSGYTLSNDSMKCELMPKKLNLCDVQQFHEQFYCSVCKQGFFRKEDYCQQCKIKNCAFCDNNEGKECYICQSNYWQNKYGECISNEKQEITFSNFITKLGSNIILFLLIIN